MIARLAERLRSLLGTIPGGKSPKTTSTQEVLGDFLGGVGTDAPGYQGNGRIGVAPPIAPRRGEADLAKIEAEPCAPDRVAEVETAPPRRNPSRAGTERREPSGWSELDFGGPQ